MPGHSVDVPPCPYLCRLNHALSVQTIPLPSGPSACRPDHPPAAQTPSAFRPVPPPLVRPSFRLPSEPFSYRPDPPSSSKLALSTENKASKTDRIFPNDLHPPKMCRRP